MANKIVLAHYMPWFTTAPIWRHWRGEGNPGRFNPEETDERGRRKIASHYYPLCAPYDSTDPEVIDRHLRLMRDSGIDGIIVDWYGLGMKPGGDGLYNDYNDLHNATMAIWKVVKEQPTGLKLALMFDGHALDAVEKCGRETAEDYARRSIEFAHEHFFQHRRYLKHKLTDEERPLSLVFCCPDTPPVSTVCWLAVVRGITPKPLMLSQDKTAAGWANGVFFWPAPGEACHNPATRTWGEAIEHFQPPDNRNSVVMEVAFPGFDDIYACDGKRQDHKNTIDRANGETYRETLQNALADSDAEYVQIVTWNDWGEGTQIEPSVEFGNRELQATREILAKCNPG